MDVSYRNGHMEENVREIIATTSSTKSGGLIRSISAHYHLPVNIFYHTHHRLPITFFIFHELLSTVTYEQL